MNKNKIDTANLFLLVATVLTAISYIPVPDSLELVMFCIKAVSNIIIIITMIIFYKRLIKDESMKTKIVFSIILLVGLLFGLVNEYETFSKILCSILN